MRIDGERTTDSADVVQLDPFRAHFLRVPYGFNRSPSFEPEFLPNFRGECAVRLFRRGPTPVELGKHFGVALLLLGRPWAVAKFVCHAGKGGVNGSLLCRLRLCPYDHPARRVCHRTIDRKLFLLFEKAQALFPPFAQFGVDTLPALWLQLQMLAQRRLALPDVILPRLLYPLFDS